MNEDELRALVRESIARTLDSRADAPFGSISPVSFRSHTSHYRYVLPKTEGPCLIEPSVQCNKCGYCESHGH
jgi:hypothetical protein